MNGPGDEFLARTALAENQYRGVGDSNGFNQSPQLGHSRGLTNDLADFDPLGSLGSETCVFLEQLVTLGAA